MNDKRYILDERVGCAAIIDTFWTNVAGKSNGLEADEPYVVRYISLPRKEEPDLYRNNLDVRQRMLTKLQEEMAILEKENLWTHEEMINALDKLQSGGRLLDAIFKKNSGFEKRHLISLI